MNRLIASISWSGPCNPAPLVSTEIWLAPNGSPGPVNWEEAISVYAVNQTVDGITIKFVA